MMETAVFETEEVKTADVMSLNHSCTIQKICSYLERYDDGYDILTQLELRLNGKLVKPDISIYPNLPEDGDTGVIFMAEPPIIAIDVLSPMQAMTDITYKIVQVCFPAGVGAVWVVLPLLQNVTVVLPNMPKITFSEGIVKDNQTGIELPLNIVFRKSR